MISRLVFLTIFIGYIFLACTQKREKSSSGEKEKSPLFNKLSPEKSGITFSNTIKDSFDFNVLKYPFIYNGGGVAIGDINNDGLSDIFFTGNMVTSRLYMNKGNMQFEDITDFAGVKTDRWITGVSMVDINNDDFLDIYLSVVSTEEAPTEERKNLLFINNGDTTFTESANKYNIADTSFTTHAAFLDYNKDGLLDLFLLNHSPGSFSYIISRTVSQQASRPRAFSTSHDRLYKNNGDGTFTDVSVEAGILKKTGYGLGVAVEDVNRDGWPDIYVSNDISPDDVLYINNRDGTFIDRSRDYLKHTSYAGMGIDIADFNNDGWPDIIQLDMMPPDYQERKLMSYGFDYEQFVHKISQGFNYSYTQNTLQMSNGLDNSDNIVYSEVGRMAGVAYTDWSWAALFGDYDNNGYKDILITNGYPKAENDYDYIIDSAQTASPEDQYQLLKSLKSLKLTNYFFKNEGNIKFRDVSEEWGFNKSTYSYGAAHADLDNDGDLDIVINNLNATASILQNNARKFLDNHYVTIQLKGPELNRSGIGTKVVLTANEESQYSYQSPYRGYQSSVGTKIHFGLGEKTHIDSLEIFWPDGRYQLLTNLAVDQQLTINYDEAVASKDQSNSIIAKNKRFTEVSKEIGLRHEHKENIFNDYRIQPLLNRQFSKMGPKIAVGDVTGNSLDDVYIGGASGYPGTLYLQQEDGKFEEFNQNQPWLIDHSSEDMGAVFFDANGDDRPDLYVASGGYEFSPAEDALLDRLYINAGDGKFYKDKLALPRMYTSSSVVVPGDFDGDGDVDLFVGGRLVPLKYPYKAKSYILQNDKGVFRDVTADIAPELVKPGLITDALWLDFDGDKQLDLVTTGEWDPVHFYKNKDGKLQQVTASVVEETQRGWWYSLEKGDFNNDGSSDIVAGNLGLNYTFATSDNKIFGVFANDFNDDMTVDIIYSIEEDGMYYPFFGKGKLGKALDFVNERYPTFASLAGVTMNKIFKSRNLDKSLHYKVDSFASTFFLNNGNGTFSVQELPEQAQISSVNEIVAHDVDHDGNLDLILAGNIFAIHPDTPKLDAGNGLWMKGDGSGRFHPISPFKSGFIAPGDVKDLKLITTPSGKAVLVANNNGYLQVFRIE